MIDGFGERTRGVAELLREDTTSFLIVTSPEHEPAREAVFLAEQLAEAGMRRDGADRQPRAPHGLDGHSAEEVEAVLAPELASRWRGARPTTWRTSTCSRAATATRSPACVKSSRSPTR